MASLRDDLIPLIDEVRRDIVDGEVGLRLYSFSRRIRTWSGASVGEGYSTDVDTVFDPVPKVMPPTPRLVYSMVGVYRDGDRVVRKISATETLSDLAGLGLYPNQELIYLVDGLPYGLVREPEKRYLEWRLHLRPAAGRCP